MKLVRQVRKTRTLNGGVLVYKDAKISLNDMHWFDVYPTSKYVLEYKLDILRALERSLRLKNESIFDLCRTVELDDGYKISPPLVEWDNDNKCFLIVDGLHRFYLAKSAGVPVKSIVVVGANPYLPVIGLPVDWHKVILMSVLPESPQLRRDLRPGIEDTSESLRKYYRDLSYLGSGGRRPSGNQKG